MGGVMKRRVVRTLTVIAAVGLAACSSGDDSPDATTAASEPASSEVIGSAPVDPNAPTLPPQSTVDDQSIGPPSQDEIGPPPETRACELSIAADVAALFDVEPGGSIERDRAGDLVCSLTRLDEQGAEEGVGSIHIVTVEADPLPAEQFAAAAAAPGAQPVDGFGDDAVWADSVLHVMVGDEVVTLALFPPTALDDDALLAVTTEWADLAMPRYRPPTPA